jgi:hypothetical protein
MKTYQNLSLREKATALLVTLFIMTILAVSIGGYLYYVKQQSLLGVHAQAWNMAICVSEAGVEEGLEQLNSNDSNLSADGWSASGTVYSMTRTFPNGNSYTVSIDCSNAFSPVITSRAYINMPSLAWNRVSPMFAVIGVSSGTATPMTRAIRATTAKGSMFLASLVAKHQINMNGNDILTDSYDSGNPMMSSNGVYNASLVDTYDSNHGDVASNDGVVNTISVGNANVYGKAYTGPGGSVSVGSQGGIGTHAWQDANGNTPEPGYVLNNANFTFPDTSLPYTSGVAPTGGDVVTISSATTNQTVISDTNSLPGSLGANQTVGGITTNSSTATTSYYPGPMAGLSTNTVWATSTTYPSGVSTVITNCITFTTVSQDPGSKMCLTVQTNYAGNHVKSVSYTYGTQFSYTYPTLTYSYPITTYSYVIYTGVITYETNHYDHILSSGDYYVANGSDLGGSTIVTGTARLVIGSGLNMSGSDQITIANGGSLKLYSGGSSMTVAGNGMVNNTGYPANLIVYAAPSVTSVSFKGNGTFSGVLVAPNAAVQLSGGGSGPQDFSGCLMAGSVTFNGHFKFHYDQALSRLGGTGRFLITSWDEIP